MEGFFAQKHNRVLGSLVLALAVLALASYAMLNLKMSSTMYPMPTNISVTGEGEASAVPNVGQFSFSVMAEGKTAAEAQEASGTKINEILAYLKEQGVEDKDVKTSGYNLNPKYRYNERMCAFGAYCPPSDPVQDGFEVSQTVEVKVRDTAKSGALIAGVGEKGATNLSGLNFIVDDLTAVKAEAREKAIVDAKQKSEKLASDLGVKIVRMTSYYENEGYYGAPMYAKAEMSADAGGDFGGAEMPVGENETTVQVNLSYEVK
jgi:uncharacterized protein YggE